MGLTIDSTTQALPGPNSCSQTAFKFRLSGKILRHRAFRAGGTLFSCPIAGTALAPPLSQSTCAPSFHTTSGACCGISYPHPPEACYCSQILSPPALPIALMLGLHSEPSPWPFLDPAAPALHWCLNPHCLSCLRLLSFPPISMSLLSPPASQAVTEEGPLL